jgi:L-threonylcarbamoyladenylate synthase
VASQFSPSTEQDIHQAIDILRGGGIVAYPTDTVYGLGADAFRDSAVERVYEAKKRPRHMALPLLLSDSADMVKVAFDVPDLAWRLAERFFPGALTLVLWKAPAVPSIVTGGGDTIAVRVPRHPIPIALIKGLGSPIIGTSANLSGQPSPLTAQEVHRQLGGKADLIIDGGRCPGGIESTVLDLTGDIPRIVREGAIPKGIIEEICQIKIGGFGTEGA